MPVVDITDPSIGAVPDGYVDAYGNLQGTDNRAAIQAAFDTGYDVEIPRGVGTFAKLGTLIMRTQSQRVFGHGADSIIGEMATSWTPAGAGSPITANGIAVEHGVIGAQIENFKLLGCAVGEDPAAAPCAVIGNTDALGYQAASAQVGRLQVSRMTFGGVSANKAYNIGLNNCASDMLTAKDIEITALIGTNSGYGYGILTRGSLPTIKGCRIFALPQQGRHPIYLSDTSDANVSGNYMFGYQRAGIPLNAGVSNSNNKNIIRGNVVESCCQSSPAAGDSAISVQYQGQATASGADMIVTSNIILNSGRAAVVAAGFQRPVISNNQITNFSMFAPSCHGIKLTLCTDAMIDGNAMLSAYVDQTLVFIENETSDRTVICNNRIRNATGTMARAAIRNNAGAPLSSSARIFNNPRFGSFLFGIENPAQSGSVATDMP